MKRNIFKTLTVVAILLSQLVSAQDAYIAEIRLFAGNFPPKNWAFCNGQTMSISQNTALFSLLGTTCR